MQIGASHQEHDPTQVQRLRRVPIGIGVVCLLAILSAELGFSARQQSQTFDEPCHIFAGYEYWKSFDFGINFEHPPLVKLVAAIPLLRLPLRIDSIPGDYRKSLEFERGREILYTNDADSILLRTRLAAACFTIALALTVFFAAYSMWGSGPAFLALALLIFEPNILAHGALVTTDVGLAFGLFLAVSTFYWYWKKPSTFRLLCAGLAAGLCLGTKHSAILVFPILLILAVAESLSFRNGSAGVSSRDPGKSALRQIGPLATVSGIALVLLWSLYGFRYAARPSGLKINPPLAQFALRMGPVGSAIVLKLAHWRLLPESYLYGLAEIYSRGGIATVIFGKLYPSSQWFYFPVLFLTKSTVALLFLCCLVPLNAALRDKKYRREVIFLVLPPLIYFGVAVVSGINYGVRHLLPIYPFLIVLAAFCAWNLAERRRAFALLVGVLLVFHAASSVRAFPNYIPYANELWGGPENAHRILSDSNVDWGQGLKAMKRYIDGHQIKDCWFAYFSTLAADPSYYGIPCKPLPTSYANWTEPQGLVIPQYIDGPVFVSSTELLGAYWMADWANPYLPLRQVRPSALIANSILMFDGRVDVSEISALTHEHMSKQFLDSKQLDRALAEAELAVKTAPNRAAAHSARGQALSSMGKKLESEEEMAQAQKIIAATDPER
jgi:dolichyl-phosphate-mannose-protein mannosyltransferase